MSFELILPLNFLIIFVSYSFISLLYFIINVVIRPVSSNIINIFSLVFGFSPNLIWWIWDSHSYKFIGFSKDKFALSKRINNILFCAAIKIYL